MFQEQHYIINPDRSSPALSPPTQEHPLPSLPYVTQLHHPHLDQNMTQSWSRFASIISCSSHSICCQDRLSVSPHGNSFLVSVLPLQLHCHHHHLDSPSLARNIVNSSLCFFLSLPLQNSFYHAAVIVTVQNCHYEPIILQLYVFHPK